MPLNKFERKILEAIAEGDVNTIAQLAAKTGFPYRQVNHIVVSMEGGNLLDGLMMTTDGAFELACEYEKEGSIPAMTADGAADASSQAATNVPDQPAVGEDASSQSAGDTASADPSSK